MFKKIIYAASASLILMSMFGCNVSSPTSPANSNPLVGTWTMTTQTVTSSSGNVTTNNASALFGNTYIFSGDYSLSGTTILFGGQFNFSGTWSSTADSVTLSLSGSSSQTWHYAVSGSNLTMTRGVAQGSGTQTTVEHYAKQ